MGDTNKIPNYTFLKGHEFTNNLKILLGCKNLHELSELTGIPRSTFSTWNMKNRTSYELMLRIHLALDIPMKDICLGYQSSNEGNSALGIAETSQPYHVNDTPEEKLIADRKNVPIIKTFDLKNGQLTNKRPTIFDSELLVDFDYDYLFAIKENNYISLIDTLSKQAINGTYLINIDGLLSMNHLQRLPGKKIAILFNNSLLNVAEEELEIVGKKVAEMSTTID
ncbi:helix-turn-helix domain-containing protein [Vibrio sp. TH_r3]|uniref:helix-turn-helix domain-containing protein n=1 Tax=Vibrio sp. TH_r3 TaxID=3082084 RepID=UPI002954937F|nr:helix-turn-helix domain-containing protein [Vibrio sp. TH_r3]MDV7103394.1 helix-turn-helix domain-containing protein [Vibrio sp. TH_r3]